MIKHLSCTDDELYELLEHLRLHTDASEAAWRDFHIRDISYAAGVRADETAFRLGVSEVREWVKRNRTEKTAADVAEAVDRLGLHAQDPSRSYRSKLSTRNLTSRTRLSLSTGLAASAAPRPATGAA